MSVSQFQQEFILQGSPVNFTNRISPKKSWSTSSMSTRSCPASAIVNNQPFQNSSPKLKRPVSADTIYYNENTFSSGFQNMESNVYCDTLPTKDCENGVSNLASSQLLKSLLSESLSDQNWNNEKQSLHKTSSYESLDSALESDKSFGQKIKEFSKRSDPGLLIPGITTKPPLPDKVKKRNENFSTKSLDLNLYPRQQEIAIDMKYDETENEQNFEQNYLINENMETNLIEKNNLKLNDNCLLEDLEEDKFEEIETNSNKESDLQLDLLNENLSNTSFKHWLQESNNLILESKLFESQTDLELQNVHQQQIEVHETLFDYSVKKHDNDININDNERNVKRNNSKSTCGSTKNFQTKSNKVIKNNNQKCNQISKLNNTNETKIVKKQPKSILKPKKTSQISQSEMSINSTIEKENCNKSETMNDDVNSWMSSNTKHESFLEFLNKLDDLEQLEDEDKQIIAQVCSLEESPEFDQENILNNTCDEIATILKVLETEELKSQKNIEHTKEILNTEMSNSSNLKNDALRSSSSSSLESTTNYNEFLCYLEEVDQNSVKTLKTAKDRVRSVTKITNSVVNNVDTIPKLEELINYSTVELSHYVVDLSLRLKEKTSGISTLQSELLKLRNLISTKSEEYEKSLKQKLKTQKDEYEGTIKRHQKFIDQLISDKKSLNQQCEGLISEMKVLEDRYNTNIRAIEQRHKVDLQKAKEMHMAGEKLRRDKWIEGKTQKIKEMTVKGLEPELQNMSARHQQELSDLRSLHKREIEDLELRAARKTQQQCEALRQQLTTERENAIAHERDILRQRLEKLVESEEKSYQEQRRRLNAEHSARLAECEDRINATVAEKERAIDAAKVEFDDKFQTALRRHKTEMKNLRESIELEFEVWKNNFKKQQAIKLTEIESQMREICKQERDREIEMVIERLEQEATDTKTQAEQAAENRLRRIKEKYEEEIIDLEKIVNEYKQKYSETKEKLLSQEDTIINLKTSMQQVQRQFQQAKQISDELSMDKTKMRDQLKEEFYNEIKSLEDQIQMLKTSRDEEMQRIFTKVKVTVARKDDLLKELTQSNTNLHEKCTLLENLLEQQRKDYFTKK